MHPRLDLTLAADHHLYAEVFTVRVRARVTVGVRVRVRVKVRVRVRVKVRVIVCQGYSDLFAALANIAVEEGVVRVVLGYVG